MNCSCGPLSHYLTISQFTQPSDEAYLEVVSTYGAMMENATMNIQLDVSHKHLLMLF